VNDAGRFPAAPASESKENDDNGDALCACEEVSRAMEIVAYGAPAPQGSKCHVGRGILVESRKRCKCWREAVHWAAIESKVRARGPVECGPWYSPCRSRSPRRSVGASGRTRLPDLDKWQRSALDALVSGHTGGGE
jgi:hypothetical protein